MEDPKVAVLLEDIKSQFRVFGEGLQILNDEMKAFRNEVNQKFDQNRQEHLLILQMIRELNEEQKRLKRVK